MALRAIWLRLVKAFSFSGILAKSEKAVAISERVSICSVRVAENLSRRASQSGALSFQAFSRYCTLSFIGVSGFLISWATWRAISRQAISLSERARASALSARASTIRLYSFTRAPISSRRGHSIFSLALPRRIRRIFSRISFNGLVKRLEMKSAAINVRAISTTEILMMATIKPEISSRSSAWRAKYGRLR